MIVGPQPEGQLGDGLPGTHDLPGPASGGSGLRNRGEPSGFSKISAPFMASELRRANREDLAALRTLLEAG